jgi:hypothetical protein
LCRRKGKGEERHGRKKGSKEVIMGWRKGDFGWIVFWVYFIGKYVMVSF